MLEIHPVSPSIPILKPKKIDRDDEHSEKQPPRKKPGVAKPDAEPLQHIDEVV
ncbi:MAG: hypothetical protein QX198_13165 [Methylococcaceae bacterium]